MTTLTPAVNDAGPNPPDIRSRADIERLVDGFYEVVRADDVLSPIFDDVAQVDWARHLPKMYAFWEAILFGVQRFEGNPLALHLALGRRVPLGSREFGRWLTLFHATVDRLFAGPYALVAKDRATRLAAMMQHHLAADRGLARA